MQQNKTTRELLTAHYHKYPKLQIRDVFKFIHQSSCGCEHMVASLEKATAYIRKELKAAKPATRAEIEPLDGNYCRVPLSYVSEGLSAETLGKLFYLSAKEEENGKAALLNKLNVAKELVEEGMLPFTKSEFEKAVEAWAADGFGAVHHSEAFRSEYAPSYRVIAKEYIPFLPLFALLDKALASGTVRLAIEGGSASGKTTLGGMLSGVYGCTVFHMDDFFLRPEQRTPERFAQVGGNVDRERFLSQVLIPLSEGKTVSYQRLDCATMTLCKPVRIAPEKLTVTEGAYSMHPELARYYDFSVFLAVSPQLQKERIMHRNSPEFAQRFFSTWIPLEEKYFAATDVKSRCDMVIEIK